MLVNQIAVFLENRAGRICEFSKVLEVANINIIAMSIADTNDYGILRIITDNNKKAVEVLRSNGFNTASTDLIGFEVSDKPGEMHKVLTILENQNINIKYLYSFVRTTKNSAVILLKVEDNNKTIEILKANGVDLLGDSIL